MKATVTYTCDCGAAYLVSVHRNESDDDVSEWQETLDEIAQRLGMSVVDQDDVHDFVCEACGAPARRAADASPDGAMAD